MSLQDHACCHPSERADENVNSYTCPRCGTLWARFPFAEAPANVQRPFRDRDIAPTHFWSAQRLDPLPA